MGSSVSSNVSSFDLKATHSDPQGVSVILVTESALKKLHGQANKQSIPVNDASVSVEIFISIQTFVFTTPIMTQLFFSFVPSLSNLKTTRLPSIMKMLNV